MLGIEDIFNKILYKLVASEPLCLGVSGGADSTAMLYLVKQYADIHHNKVVVVTVDHMLREAAKDEAAYVARICANMGIEHRTIQWQHDEVASGKIERMARQARYEILQKEALERGIRHILVAHNADEQLETYFIRKEMHSEERGLACMSAKRTVYRAEIYMHEECSVQTIDISNDLILRYSVDSGRYMSRVTPGARRENFAPGVHKNDSHNSVENVDFQSNTIDLIRPCLSFAKKELQDYLHSKHVTWFEDSMNSDESFIRVKYRHKIAQMTPEERMRILSEIHRLGEKRQRIENLSTTFIRTHGIMSGEGFAQISREEFGRLEIDVQKDVLKRVIKCIGNRQYSISDAVCQEFLDKDSYSAGNVVMKKTKRDIIVFYENRRFGPIIEMKQGEDIMWNDRFRIKALINGLSIKPFGYPNLRKIYDLPSYVAASLPEFLINGSSVHVGSNDDSAKGFLCNFVVDANLYDVFLPS